MRSLVANLVSGGSLPESGWQTLQYISLISDSGYFFVSWVATPWVFIDCKGSGF